MRLDTCEHWSKMKVKVSMPIVFCNYTICFIIGKILVCDIPKCSDSLTAEMCRNKTELFTIILLLAVKIGYVDSRISCQKVGPYNVT